MKKQQELSVADVTITRELGRRTPHQPDFRTESLALHALAHDLATTPERVLGRLVHIARELCRAGSAGVSLFEKLPDGKEAFRWAAVAGKFEPYSGMLAPGDNSPCAICYETNSHQLFSHPEKYFAFYKDLQPSVQEALYFPLFTDNRQQGSLWIVSHDAELVFDSEDIRVLKGLAGFTSGALKMLRLVSSQQKSREEAEVAKTSYLNLLNSLSDVVVWESDPSRKLSFISRSVERLFGYSRERWLNEPDFLSQIVHPEDKQAAAQLFKISLESSLSQEVEFRCVASDSHVLWLKHKVDVVRDSQTGMVRQLRGTMTDISKSKQTEITLRDKEDFLKELLRSLPLAVYICDKELGLKQWNSRAVQIWGAEPASGLNEQDFYKGMDFLTPSGSRIEYEQLPVYNVLKTGNPVLNYVISLLRHDGKAFVLIINASPLKNTKGEIIGAICCFEESKTITIEDDLRAAQEKLLAAGIFSIMEDEDLSRGARPELVSFNRNNI